MHKNKINQHNVIPSSWNQTIPNFLVWLSKGCCALVPGSRFLALGPLLSVLGSWFLVLGSWLLAPGSLFLILGSLFFTSCEPPTEQGIYEEKLVVFGNLIANTPIVDTVYISLSYEINERYEGDDMKWVSDAVVTIIGNGDTIPMLPVAGRSGRYFDYDTTFSHFIMPNIEYTLTVDWEDYHVTATTLVPDTFFIQSISSDYWECDNEPVFVNSINLYEKENDLLIKAAFLTGRTDILLTLPMDTVVYKEDPCYTSSFVSVPFFILEWEAEIAPGMVRAYSWALEDTVMDFEPYEDENENGEYDEGEPYEDVNQSGTYNRYLVNSIIDTSFSAVAFKGPMFRDEEGNFYRPNPNVWSLIQKELDFMWLSFNYYGVHLIMIQATDDSYSDYFMGDAFRQNQYILPNSNISDGYGLFSSSFFRYFLVYIAPDTTE